MEFRRLTDIELFTLWIGQLGRSAIREWSDEMVVGGDGALAEDSTGYEQKATAPH